MFWIRAFRNRDNAPLLTAFGTIGTFLVGLVAAGAAIYYAGVTKKQWQAAKVANEIAVEANRPWIGSIPKPGDDPTEQIRFEPRHDKDGEFTNAKYVWFFKNAGKRPARVENIQTASTWEKECTENPDYTSTPPGTIRPFSGETSKAFIVPEVTIKSLYQVPISDNIWQEIRHNDRRYCIYSLIEYRDADYPQIMHHTKDCRMLIPFPEGEWTFQECRNNYPSAD